MPASLTQHYWSDKLLRVLEKATQTRPENRYQTVQEFWDELAEAALPPTKRLTGDTESDRAGGQQVRENRKPSSDLAIEPEEFTSAPPKPRFEPVQTPPALAYADASAARRPKIVVPVSALEKTGQEDLAPRLSAQERIAALPNQAKNGSRHPRRPPAVPRNARPFLVAAVLILLFTGMLLATHKYVTSYWNPFAGVSQVSDIFVIGREGITTTDVRLRPDPSTSNPPIGLAENGSRVKVLSATENWYEVKVLEHGRPKTDLFTSDQGWINKKFVKFN